MTLLPVASLGLRLRGLGPVQRAIGRPRRDRSIHSDPTPLAIAASVDAAARVWPANCLQRSVTLWWMLRRRGIDSDLRIGVRSDLDGPAFHAWVVHRGNVLNDLPDVDRRFKPFDRAILPPDAHFQ